MADVPEDVEAEYSNQCYAEPQQQTYNLMNNPNLVSAGQKLWEQQPPVVVLPIVKHTVESLKGPLTAMMKDMVRKVVNEELERRLNAGGQWMSGDGTHSTEQRNLALKFSDKVSLPVYTGKEIKGKRGDNIRVNLVDADENLVKSGAEASSEVEIMVVLPDGNNDDGESSSASGESFSGSGTKSSEKKLRRPRLSKKYLKLKEGIAVVENVKFKNMAKWTRGCTIKLVARAVGNFKGATVKDAETERFRVSDHRVTLYTKHDPPVLEDQMWRLRGISRNKELHKLLEKEKINSVQRFLILHNTDPQSLQQRLNISEKKLKDIVDKANKCEIPAELYTFHYSPSSETNFAVVFDVVGCLQGITLLHENHRFVPVDELNEEDKVAAKKMVKSACENWWNEQSYDNEASSSVFSPYQVPNGPGISPYQVPNGPGISPSSSPVLEPNRDGLDRAETLDLGPFWSPENEWLQDNVNPETEYLILYDENLLDKLMMESENVPSPGTAKGELKRVAIFLASVMKFLSIREEN